MGRRIQGAGAEAAGELAALPTRRRLHLLPMQGSGTSREARWARAARAPPPGAGQRRLGQRIRQIGPPGHRHALLDAGETGRVERPGGRGLERKRPEPRGGGALRDHHRILTGTGFGGWSRRPAWASRGRHEQPRRLEWTAASGADFIVTSATSAGGVPGCGMVLPGGGPAGRGGGARSLSLDLTINGGSWRRGGQVALHLPHHVVAPWRRRCRGSGQGGVPARAARYGDNQRRWWRAWPDSLRAAVAPVVADAHLTSFRYPTTRFAFRASTRAEGRGLRDLSGQGHRPALPIGNKARFAETSPACWRRGKSRYWL